MLNRKIVAPAALRLKLLILLFLEFFHLSLGQLSLSFEFFFSLFLTLELLLGSLLLDHFLSGGVLTAKEVFDGAYNDLIK